MTDMSEMDRQLELVQRNAKAGRNFTNWRDEAIVRARHEGATFQQIADRAGLTLEGVRQIVVKALDNSVEGSTIGL